MQNLLEKGLSYLSPNEAEGASLPPELVKEAFDNWKALNPTLRVNPKNEAALTKVLTTDIPKVIKTSSSPVDITDKKILDEITAHPYLPYLNGITLSNLRAETSALPNELHDIASPSIKLFRPPALFSPARGYYSNKTGTSVIGYNPRSNIQGTATPGHEWTHLVTMSPELQPTLPPKLQDLNSLTDNLSNIFKSNYTDLIPNINNLSALGQSKLQRMDKFYHDNPMEQVARSMGSSISRAVQDSGRIKNVKDYQTFLANYERALNVANAKAKYDYPNEWNLANSMTRTKKTTSNPDIALPLSGEVSLTPSIRKQNVDYDSFDRPIESKSALGISVPDNHSDLQLARTGFDKLAHGVLEAGVDAAAVPAKLLWNTTQDYGKAIKNLAQMSGDAWRGKLGSYGVAQPMSDLFNIATGNSLVGGLTNTAEGGLGALGMGGFYSKLTKGLEDRGIGKSVISEKMSGEQALKTLMNAGISNDELKFTGVGEALASIGKDRIGKSKFDEITKMARDNALGFTKEIDIGTYPKYSLFQNADEFNTAKYKYPGVNFVEPHFGEGVVAHRRYGEKEISLPNGEKVPSMHLDEVQSNYYALQDKRKGNRSDLAGDFYGVDLANDFYGFASKDNLKEISPEVQKDISDYNNVSHTMHILDRSKPEGMADYLTGKERLDKIKAKYNGRNPDDVPLKGTKYLELLAKDHIQDAIKSGKDYISWTPGDIQFDRYYHDKALENIKWSFGDGKIKLQISDGDIPIDDLSTLSNYVGKGSAHSVVAALRKGETSGEVKFEKPELYAKTYDRELPKIFEKLTGEKMQVGTTTDSNGKEVNVYYSGLRKLGNAGVHFVEPTKGDYIKLIKAVTGFKDIDDAIKENKVDLANSVRDQTSRGNDNWSPIYSNIAFNKERLKAFDTIKKSMEDGKLLERVNSMYGKYAKNGSISNDKDLADVVNTMTANKNKVKAEIAEKGATSSLRKELSDREAELHAFLLLNDLIKFQPQPLPIASNEQQAKDFFNV